MAERLPNKRIITAKSKGNKEKKDAENGVAKFLAKAHSRFKLAAEAEVRTREGALDDMKFSIGEQWPEDVRVARTTEGKPCLTMNRMPQSIRQVTNEYRQQRPSVQVNPVGNGASKDASDVLEGIVRHIEVHSKAHVADDIAFDHMVRCGFGWEELITQEVGEDGEQEIVIKPVRNGFSIYGDPASEEPDYSDMNWAFKIRDYPIEEYEEEFPDSEISSLHDFTSLGDQVPGWANKQKRTVRVAAYYYVEKKAGKRVVHYSLINAMEVLDGNDAKTAGREWPGPYSADRKENRAAMYIPYLKVVGDDLVINGERHQAGLVRHAKDPQRQYNVMCSASTQAAMLAPNAPFIAAEGQMEGHEEEWRRSNRRMDAVLVYKEKAVGGTPLPAPERNTAEPPIQAFGALLSRAEVDLQATMGIYNAALGKPQSEDQSGAAIRQLQSKSDISTLNFSDNAARMIEFRGRQILSLIPMVYDTPQIMRIINPDSTVRHVVTHAGDDQADAAQDLIDEEAGIKEIFDVSVGDYDCTVSVGPSYQTKRQEAVATQLDLMKILPQQMVPTLLDLVVRNMDIPQASEMADRLKKQLPANLQEDASTKGDPQAQIQQLQAQLGQLTQQHGILTNVVKEQSQIIDTKQAEQQAKVQIAQLQAQNQRDIAQMKVDADIAKAEIATNSQQVGERIQWLQQVWSELHGAAHEQAMQQVDHAHQAQQAQAAQAAAAQQQQQAQQAEQQQPPQAGA